MCCLAPQFRGSLAKEASVDIDTFRSTLEIHIVPDSDLRLLGRFSQQAAGDADKNAILAEMITKQCPETLIFVIFV